MDDNTFLNKLAEKLSKLGTVRPLGFHYLHPYGTVPADSIICNGATYSRALYKDFFDYITTQGWVKTEAEWQEIATRDNGFCPFYSDGDGSTNFRTPKFAPYQQIAMEVAQATQYHQAGLPNVAGNFADMTTETQSDIDKLITYATGCCTYKQILGDRTVVALDGIYTRTNRYSSAIDASRNSKVYGASATVTPESHSWVMCVVAYGIATNVGSVDIQNVMSAVNAVQASITDIENSLSSIVKFAAPDYSAGAKITADTPTIMQANGFIRYYIVRPSSGSNIRHITINGTQLEFSANNYSSDRGILPVIKGDTVIHDGVDEVVFFPARYAS